MKHGFSLVELSIVLVILGLLVGGVLAGKSLIRAAELRSVSSDSQRYKSALAAFRDKYFYLPGDMPNAVKFWGAQAGGTADGTDSTCAALDYNNPATGQSTCNGDGNGNIGRLTNFCSSSNHETFRAWQHLANAGMVEGQYAGVTDSVINTYSGQRVVTPGWNVPASRIGKAGYGLVYWGTVDGALVANQYFSGYYGNVLLFGQNNDNLLFHSMNLYGVITGSEAWNIDTKLDDGLPGQGAVMTTSALCATTIDAATATYPLTGTSTNCGLIFKTGL